MDPTNDNDQPVNLHLPLNDHRAALKLLTSYVLSFYDQDTEAGAQASDALRTIAEATDSLVALGPKSVKGSRGFAPQGAAAALRSDDAVEPLDPKSVKGSRLFTAGDARDSASGDSKRGDDDAALLGPKSTSGARGEEEAADLGTKTVKGSRGADETRPAAGTTRTWTPNAANKHIP